MAALALMLGIGGALLIERITQDVSDRLLAASTRAIVETLAVEDGVITLDLPPFALGMLESVERDNIYYSVIHDGRVLTGYPELPAASGAAPQRGETAFGYSRYRGQTIRLATQSRYLPQIQKPVLVTTAETMDSRNALETRMLMGLAALEFSLVLITAALIPFAVHWGVRPLHHLQAELEARSGEGSGDFTPLPTARTPSELTPLVNGFNILLSRLERLIEASRRFSADASHQMRTPLSVLRTHVDILKRPDLSALDRQHALDDIDHAIQRLERLLLQLLAQGRADHDRRRRAPRQMVDLVATARSVLAEIAPMAVERHIDVTLDSDRPVMKVRSDSETLVEMLANLIDNAVRYNRPGGSVLVRVLKRGDHLVIQVDDTGPGVKPEDRDRVFERFIRLRNSNNEPGSGLGLSIVKALADQIGIDLVLTDRGDEPGARFELWFRPMVDR